MNCLGRYSLGKELARERSNAGARAIVSICAEEHCTENRRPPAQSSLRKALAQRTYQEQLAKNILGTQFARGGANSMSGRPAQSKQLAQSTSAQRRRNNNLREAPRADHSKRATIAKGKLPSQRSCAEKLATCGQHLAARLRSHLQSCTCKEPSLQILFAHYAEHFHVYWALVFIAVGKSGAAQDMAATCFRASRPLGGFLDGFYTGGG